MEKIIVMLASLGLCEHCNVLVTMENMPSDAIDAEWRCPKCSGILTGKTFGYNAKNEKIRWVGPSGKWTHIKPNKDFELGNWEIMIKPPRYY